MHLLVFLEKHNLNFYNGNLEFIKQGTRIFPREQKNELFSQGTYGPLNSRNNALIFLLSKTFDLFDIGNFIEKL